MAFDFAKACIFVTQIAKADHQQPLERSCPALERLYPAVARVQLADPFLKCQLFLEQRAYQSFPGKYFDLP
jgi:hypothetical protein